MQTRFLPLLFAILAFLLVASLAAFQSAPAAQGQFLDVLKPGAKIGLKLDGDGLFNITMDPRFGLAEVTEVGRDWFSCATGSDSQRLPVLRIPQTAIRSIQIWPQPPK